MSYKLNYTFLGQKNEDSSGQYTPLIIPKMPSAKSQPNFSAQQGQQIPASRIGVDNVTSYENKDSTFQGGVTPFSRIRNYYFEKIANQNFSNMSSELIDVVKNFVWTISPQSAKTGTSDYDLARENNNRKIADEVPYVEIKEKYFLVNNIVAQALYSISAGNNLGIGLTGKTLSENLAGMVDNFAQDTGTVGVGEGVATEAAETATVALDAAGKELTNAQQSELATIRKGASMIQTLGQGAAQLYEALANYQDPDLEAVLFPYQRLYFTGPTGFQYKIPYLSPRSFDHNNNFSSLGSSEGGALGSLMDDILTGLTGAQNLVNLGTQAGKSYIERVQTYDYPTQDSDIEVKLPLYNTTPATYQDICNNFKLCFLLLYQNSPLKQDKLVVEPPCLYDVKIPGMKRHPYCYLSSITVTHQGNTRVMDIDISDLEYAAGGPDLLPNGTVQAIIPDAYLLTMSFRPVLTQTKNLLFTTISDHDTVVATET